MCPRQHGTEVVKQIKHAIIKLDSENGECS
jgi:hypothetical protein